MNTHFFYACIALCISGILTTGCGNLLSEKTHQIYDTLYVISPSTGTITQLSPNTNNNYTEGDWSPDNAQVAYASPDLGDIFITSANGGTATNLTQTADKSESRPKWSPNGNLLAYYIKNGIYNSLYVKTIPNGTPQLLLDQAEGFSWSPNSDKIAVISQGKIYIVNTNGSIAQVYNNTSHPPTSEAPIWLSATVLRYTDRHKTSLLINTNAQAIVELLHTEHAQWSLPSTQVVCPPTDGCYVVATTGSVQKVLAHASFAIRNTTNTRLFSVYQNTVYRHNSDGTNRTVIFPSTGHAISPLLPSSARIAFAHYDQIYTAPIDSGDATALVSGTHPKWSPDGNHLLYSGTRRVSK